MSSTANSSLFIPTKIKVGFQSRTDTYTNQLAYIIYFDHKGTLRKERSCNDYLGNQGVGREGEMLIETLATVCGIPPVNIAPSQALLDSVKLTSIVRG